MVIRQLHPFNVDVKWILFKTLLDLRAGGGTLGRRYAIFVWDFSLPFQRDLNFKNQTIFGWVGQLHWFLKTLIK